MATEEYYNKFYAQKDWKHIPAITKFKTKVYLKIARAVFKKKIKKVVDAGCGTGIHSAILQSSGYEVSGFDFSEVAIQKAKEKFDSIDFRVLDGGNINYDNDIDCFLALGFSPFNSTDFEKTSAIIEHWNSFLNPGGLVVITSRTDFSQKYPTGWYYHSQEDLDKLYSGDKMRKQQVYLYPPLWTLVYLFPKSKGIIHFLSWISKGLFVKTLGKSVTAVLILQKC